MDLKIEGMSIRDENGVECGLHVVLFRHDTSTWIRFVNISKLLNCRRTSVNSIVRKFTYLIHHLTYLSQKFKPSETKCKPYKYKQVQLKWLKWYGYKNKRGNNLAGCKQIGGFNLFRTWMDLKLNGSTCFDLNTQHANSNFE